MTEENQREGRVKRKEEGDQDRETDEESGEGRN